MTTEDEKTLLALIDQYCGPDISAAQKESILEKITQQYVPSLTLVKTIQLLGPYISSDNDQIRSRSYLILQQVLKLAPVQSNDQTLNSLCSFFADRMQDFEGLPDLLPAVYYFLSRWVGPTQQSSVSYLMLQYVLFVSILLPFFFRRLFNEVSAQALAVHVRKVIFNIAELFLIKFPASMYIVYSNDLYFSVCKIEFVTGLAQIMDGERDPVNLLFLFEFICKIAKEIPKSLEGAAEEVFDVLSCYFPINFTPPPNDPRGITSDQLSTALR